MLPRRRLSTASAIRAQRKPPNGNVPVRTDASFEANASRNDRRDLWSLVFTVSGRKPSARAVSSMLISSTARIMNTIRNGSGSSSMLRSRRSPISCRAAACSGSMVPPPSGNGIALAPAGGVESIQVDDRMPLAPAPERFVQHDPCQPCREAGVIAELTHGCESPDVGFLKHVLGLAVVLHDTSGDAVKALVVAQHDGAESARLASLGQEHQIEVVEGRESRLCRLNRSHQ